MRKKLATLGYMLVLFFVLVPIALVGFWWILIPAWRGRIRTVLQGREYG